MTTGQTHDEVPADPGSRVSRRGALLGAAAAAVAGALVGGGAIAVSTRDGEDSPSGGGTPVPGGESVDDALVGSRAFEAVVWGMPIVNFDRMLQASIAVGAGANTIVYWSRLVDWKNQTLTPNPNAIYLMPFYDTSTGPMVLDIPPAQGDSTITGSIDSAWQTPLADVGPAGTDRGAGGRYLILPPGYAGDIPDGYIVLRSETNAGFALLRSNLTTGDDADLARAVAYGTRIGFYPLGAAPTATSYVDASGKEFDATIPYDREFFTALNRQVQAEPWLARDMAMIDQLRTIGIVKGATYQPDPTLTSTLDAAAVRARDWLEQQYVAAFDPPFYPGSHWAVPVNQNLIAALQNGYADPAVYPIDARGLTYSFIYFAAKTLGSGQFYLETITDRDGHDLDGAKNYTLTVPADAPVSLYWSLTAYDRGTHTLIRDVDWPSRASNTPGLVTDSDGSVRIYIGPTPPAGKGTSNWLPTKAGSTIEIMARFYGPQPALLDKTWTLPDIEPA
ncbi:DUF1254 domain-containing protein [Nocardia sp. NPDC055321]